MVEIKQGVNKKIRVQKTRQALWRMEVYYPCMYHMFEYLRFEKRCSTLNIMAKLISLIC